jgi:hypothetical protein
MNNVLLDDLPTEWNGYQLNTWYQIGLQIQLLQTDTELSANEKNELVLQLLFCNEDGTLRDYPDTAEELNECIDFFLNGWFHDNKIKQASDKQLMDFDIDQWRIYADFLHIYHIDLATVDMHWWMFNGLLWNLPSDQSSFMQVIEIRQKKPRNKASADEKKAIELGHKIYDIKKQPTFTKEQEEAIDEFDKWLAEKKKESILEEAQEVFNNM